MSRQTRSNVFMNVEPTNPEPPPLEEEVLDMKPPEEIPKPTEKEIFRKPELKLEKPIVKRKADRITDNKRTVTPKMRAHLDRIRTKATEAKKKKACEKAGLPYEPPAEAEAEPMPSPLAPQPVAQAPSMPTIQESVRSIAQHPQPVAPNVAPSIDYDRIVNGLWSRQQKYNEEQKYMAQLRDQIRKEEREKAMKESTGLLQQAAVKYKKAHQAQLGNSVLQNFQNRYQGHPVFKVKQNGGKYQASGGGANPFDVCFK